MVRSSPRLAGRDASGQYTAAPAKKKSAMKQAGGSFMKASMIKSAAKKKKKKPAHTPNYHCGRGRAGIKGPGRGRPGKTCANST